jgi:hypothetical protein
MVNEIPNVKTFGHPSSPELELLILLKTAQDFEGQIMNEVNEAWYEQTIERAEELYKEYPYLPVIRFPVYGW